MLSKDKVAVRELYFKRVREWEEDGGNGLITKETKNWEAERINYEYF